MERKTWIEELEDNRYTLSQYMTVYLNRLEIDKCLVCAKALKIVTEIIHKERE